MRDIRPRQKLIETPIQNSDDKTMDSTVSFYNFIQWLSKEDKIQLDSYKLSAIVTYETDNIDYSFYNKEMNVQVFVDSQRVGGILLPDIDTDKYFSEFIVIWQDFDFDAHKDELMIKSRVATNIKKFSTYTITIRNIKKTNF